jgi:hypothetical protein
MSEDAHRPNISDKGRDRKAAEILFRGSVDRSDELAGGRSGRPRAADGSAVQLGS